MLRATRTQMELARKIERAGLATVSQALKAIERSSYDSGERKRLEYWKRQLAAKEDR